MISFSLPQQEKKDDLFFLALAAAIFITQLELKVLAELFLLFSSSLSLVCVLCSFHFSTPLINCRNFHAARRGTQGCEIKKFTKVGSSKIAPLLNIRVLIGKAAHLSWIFYFTETAARAPQRAFDNTRCPNVNIEFGYIVYYCVSLVQWFLLCVEKLQDVCLGTWRWKAD